MCCLSENKDQVALFLTILIAPPKFGVITKRKMTNDSYLVMDKEERLAHLECFGFARGGLAEFVDALIKENKGREQNTQEEE